MTTAVLLVLLGALSRLLPHPPNFVAMGALALYAGARLPRRWAIAVPLAALALSDLVLDAGTGRAVVSGMRLSVYATFAAIVVAGRFLRPSSAPGRLAGFSAGASVLFFLTSNFAEWLGDPLYPRTAAGLALCFTAAVPFFWNTFAADLLGTATLFGLDAVSRRERSRAVGAAAAAATLFLLVPGQARGQQVPPASESVVVTATSVPEDEKDIGSAITVITRQELEKHESAVVSDVLRAVPGLDVTQYGQPGSLTSLFTRGTNSTQTLVLVDGVRMNSPYFSGYDWSSMTTENIERIEIVRGPFSALYGSDAIGGVVQVFTRPGAEGVVGRATGEAGNQGAGAGLRLRLRRGGAVLGRGELSVHRLRRQRSEHGLARAQRLGVPLGAPRRHGPHRRRVGVERRRSRKPRGDRGLRVSFDRARLHARDAHLGARQLLALGRQPPRRPARGRPVQARLPGHGRRTSSRRPTRARCRRASPTRRSSATTS